MYSSIKVLIPSLLKTEADSIVKEGDPLSTSTAVTAAPAGS